MRARTDYALLRTLPTGSEGTLSHYEQNVDPEEGSIVSHGALAFSRVTPLGSAEPQNPRFGDVRKVLEGWAEKRR